MLPVGDQLLRLAGTVLARFGKRSAASVMDDIPVCFTFRHHSIVDVTSLCSEVLHQLKPHLRSP